MSYKNSFKLLTTNFSLVWKQLAYMLVMSLIVLLLGYCFSLPTISLLKDQGVIEEFTAIFETIYTAPKEVVTAISDAFLHFSEVISSNFSKIWFSIILTTVVIPFIYQFLKNFSFYNLANLMHYQLTCFVQIGYTRNLITNLTSGVKYSLAKTIYSLPFGLLKIGTLFLYFTIAVTPLGIFIGLFIVSLILILISAVELTLFSGLTGFWLEKQNQTNVFKAFFTGNLPILRNFPRVFSNSVISVITIVVVNIFFGIFTLGVGLLITLPASMLFVAIFELCSYFGVTGERYYLTKTIIATPLNLNENENINNIK